MTGPLAAIFDFLTAIPEKRLPIIHPLGLPVDPGPVEQRMVFAQAL